MDRRYGHGKALTKLQKSLIILSVAGAFFPWKPEFAEASSAITTTGKTGTTVSTIGNVTTVTTSTIVGGKTAVNSFDKYTVDKGNIVNMHFGDKASSGNADNLVNLVNEKIDINGTVNAIQNNKIGGNMYFLSSQGIAVGADGVINAGSLYMMTPTSTVMNNIFDNKGAIDESNLNSAMGGNIALNPEATITVAGKINVNNNALVTGGVITTATGSEIKTGVTDFSSLVNLSGVDSGLVADDQKLSAAPTDGGKISLIAMDVAVANDTKHNFTATVENNGNLTATGKIQISAIAGSPDKYIETTDYSSNVYTAKVTVNGNVTAAGNVGIQAYSSTYERFADKTAQVDVNGNVKGANVDISASAINYFVEDNVVQAKNIVIDTISTFTGLQLDADYANIKNNAVVNINKDAVITTTAVGPTVKEDGEDKEKASLNISAGSGTTVVMGASSSSLRITRAFGANAANVIPAASVVVLKSNNDATVNMNGTLISKGKTTVKAAANSDLDTSADVGVTADFTKSPELAMASVNVLNATNNATVNVGDTAKLTKHLNDKLSDVVNLEKDITIQADATNSISTDTGAYGDTGSFMLTTVNVINYDSAANVSVNAPILAPSIYVLSNNTTSSDKLGASNTASDAPYGSWTELFLQSKTFENMMTKMFGDMEGDNSTDFAAGLKDYATIGASIGVANENFNANIDIGPRADLEGTTTTTDTSKDSYAVKIAAKSDIQDISMSSSGKVSADKDSKQTLGVDAAVLVTNIKNNSKVTFDGGTTAEHSKVNGQAVSVTSDAKIEYQRPKKLVKGFIKAVDALVDEFTKDKKVDQSDLDTLKAYVTDLETASNSATGVDYTADDLEKNGGAAGDEYKGLLGKCTVVGDWLHQHVTVLPSNVEGLYKKIIAFAKPNSYANFSVTSTSTGKSDTVKVGIAGAIGVINVDNNSSILVGKNNVLTGIGTDRSLNLKANANANTVTYIGDAGTLFLPTSSKAAGGGASIAVEHFNNNSVILVAQGAQLSSKDITAEADSTLRKVGITFTSGETKSIGIQGMVSYEAGQNDSIVSIDDQAQLVATNKLDIKSVNDMGVYSIAGGFSKSNGTSVGLGVAINNFDVSNYVVVGNNDSDANLTEETDAATDTVKAANKTKKATKKAWELAGLDGDDQTNVRAALLGSAAVSDKGKLSAATLNATATTSGYVHSIGAAASMATNEKDTKFDKVTQAIDTGLGWITNPVAQIIKKVSSDTGAQANAAAGAVNNAANNNQGVNQGAANVLPAGDQAQVNAGGANAAAGQATSLFNLAGSAAVNLLSGDTAALVDNTVLSGDATSGSTFKVEATDDLFTGAWSGAAAFNFSKASAQGSSSMSVGVSGVLAYNDINRDLMSVVSNSTVTDAAALNVVANKKGAEVAAGLGLGYSSSGTGAAISVEIVPAGSINSVNSNVYSFLINDTQNISSGTTLATDVSVTAQNTDTQVTGGVNVDVARGNSGSTVGAGLSYVVALLNNDVAAGIEGGTYNAVNNVTVNSILGTRQVTAGVGVTFTSSTGDSFTGALDGSLAYAGVVDKTRGYIDGATITSTNASGKGKVAVKAYDQTPDDTIYKDFLSKRGLDADGSSYVASGGQGTTTGTDNETKANDSLDKAKADTNYTGAITTALGKTGEAGGNTIVNGSIAIAATKGKGAAGIAVGIANVENDFTANISGSTISSGIVQTTAENDTFVFDLVAGASGTTKREGSFTGAGSFDVNNLAGNTMSEISNSTINTRELTMASTNHTTSVNIGGQVAVGSVGAGLAFVWTNQNNSAKTHLLGSTINPLGTAASVDLDLAAANTTGIYSIGVGVDVSTNTGAGNGLIVINSGTSNVEAYTNNITETTYDAETKTLVAKEKRHTNLNKVNKLSVKADDKTTQTAIAGGVTAGSGGAIGGAIAYNDVGGSSSDTADAKQILKAALNSTDITTVDDSTIDVLATEKEKLTTVAAGLAYGSKFAVQGAAAVSLINREMKSEIYAVKITPVTGTVGNATVNVKTDNSEEKISNAATVVGGSGKVGAGIGIAVNRIEENNSANIINGSDLKVKSALVSSLSQPRILNIGIGIGAGGTGAFGGSVGINTINNTNIAKINGSTINATGSVGVVAQTDDVINNYAGSVAGAKTGAVGVSVTVNTVDGQTNAIVNDSTIAAEGGDSGISVNNGIADATLDKGIVSTATFGFGIGDGLSASRTGSTVKGLAVDASSSHVISSDLATVGVSGSISISGTVNVNRVKGSTEASISDSTGTHNINNGTGAVAVKATDYSYAGAFVGNISGSGSAALGAASDFEVFDRNVKASVAGNAKTDKNLSMTAGDVSIGATSKQGVSSLLVGGSFSGTGSLAAGITSFIQKSVVTASTEHLTATADKFDLTADHYASLGQGNNNIAVGANVGVGATFAILSDTNKVNATMDNSTVTASKGATVKADDETKITTENVSIGAAFKGAGFGGSFAFNNLTNQVGVSLKDSSLTGSSVEVGAINHAILSSNGGALGGAAVGVGVSLVEDTIENATTVTLNKANLKATAGDVDVYADEIHDVKGTVISLAVGIGAIDVNVVNLQIGKETTTTSNDTGTGNDTKKDDVQNQTDATVDAAITQANAAQTEGTSSGLLKDVKGLSSSEITDLLGNITTVVTNGKAVDQKDSVSVATTGGSVIATGDVKVGSTAINKLDMSAGSGGLGLVSASIATDKAVLNNNVFTNISGTTLQGTNVKINANLGGTKQGVTDYGKVLTGVGAAAGLNLSIPGAIAISNGSVATNVNDATIIASKDIAIDSNDNSSIDAQVYGVSLGIINVSGAVSSADNNVKTTVTLGDETTKNSIEATDAITVTANRAGKVNAYTLAGNYGAVTLAGASSTAKSTGNSAINVIGSQSKYTAASITMDANNVPVVSARTWNNPVDIISVQVANTKSTITLGSSLSIADNNTFSADAVEFAAIIGDADVITNTATTRGVSIGGVSAAPNYSEAVATNTITVNVGKETYKTNTDGTALTNLVIAAANGASQYARTDLVNGSIVALGTGQAKATQTNTTTLTATSGGDVASLLAAVVGETGQTVKAVGNGGGLVTICPYAAESTSTITNTSTIDFGGIWNATGRITLGNIQIDNVDVHVDTNSGGVVDVGGAQIDNTITDTTKVNVQKNTQINAGEVYAVARNTVNADKEDLTAEGISGGAVASKDVVSNATITTTAAVDIATGVNVTTDNSQKYEAYTQGTLKNNVKAISGGLFAGAYGLSKNIVKTTDTVTAAANTSFTVNSYKGSNDKVNAVTMAASDQLNETAITTATSGGLATGVEAHSENENTRTATVTFNGTIYSAGDVNLYAGADGDAKSSSLIADMEANAYSNALLPGVWSKLKNTVEEYNQVKINTGAIVNATRTINLIGSSGDETIAQRAAEFAWYKGETGDKQYVGNNTQNPNYGQTTDNYVLIDGTLNAGLENKVTINISGQKAPVGAEFVDATGKTGKYTYDVLSGKFTRDTIYNGITTGTFNYANNLYTRYQDLNKLIADYAIGDKQNLTAYYGYIAEQQSILEQMKKAGLVDISDSGTVTNPVESVDTNYISLPDITVSGGDIKITSDNLGGKGTFKADGSPQITINNTSDAYLKINNLTLGDDGGGILYNKVDISGASNATINGMNKQKKTFAEFPETPSGGASTSPTISVTTNYTGGSYDIKLVTPISGAASSITYKPFTDIEINGLVTNNLGEVDIDNKSGSIIIQAGETQAKAGLFGKVINLKATGSVREGYTDGIVNIGSTPEIVYKTFTENEEAFIRNLYGNANTSLVMDKSLPNTSVSKTPGTWIVGGSVYISASAINVNGLVQSGYDKYYATLAADALDNLSQYTQTEVVGGTKMYKLNDGNKAVYNDATGMFDYLVQLYYNPEDKNVVVADINTDGGIINLTGKIASTGNGNLVAADGGSDIEVTNNTSHDMKVGQILNNSRTGSITITDMIQMKQTVYTKDKTVVYDLNKSTSDDTRKTELAASNTYAVKSGLRYNWTDGTDKTTRNTYEKTIDNSWWGAGGDSPSPADLKNAQTQLTPTTQNRKEGANKQSGVYIDTVDRVAASSNYSIVFDNVLGADTISDVSSWTTSSGLFGFYKHHHFRWTDTQGSSQTYVHSFKADYDIGVKFIGKDGDINVYGGADVGLNGNIKNAAASSLTNITSKTGSITQAENTYITGNNINLSAVDDIKNIAINSMAIVSGSNVSDMVNLKAVSTAGNVDVSVSGGSYNKSPLAGNVNLLALKGKGEASLKATGNITQSGTDLTVKADRINLSSVHGTLGTASQAIILEGGQTAIGQDRLAASVNASAQGNIYLTQNSGNMRIGTIVSDSGDVALTATGGDFVDALPVASNIPNSSVDATIQNWMDMGLIAGEGVFSKKLEQQRTDYKEGVENAYADYVKLVAYYSDANHATEKKSESFDALDKKFSKYSSAADYLAADQDYQKLLAAPSYDFTKEDLLYSIKNAVINKTYGSTDNELKAANVSGKNIILNGKGVGSNDEASKVFDLKNLTIDDLKTLANANAADVEWNIDDSTATLTGKRALGVSVANDGQITINVNEDAYIASRFTNGSTDKSGPKLTINTINATGNVRVLGKQSVVAGKTDTTTADITANGVYLEGGTGDIGASDRYMLLNTTATGADKGEVGAIADGSIYLRSIGTTPSSVYLGAMYAGKDIHVDGAGRNIEMTTLEDSGGYLNALGQIYLTNDKGFIGAETNPIRIKNGTVDSNIIDLTAYGDIYLKGMTSKDVTDPIMSVKNVVSQTGNVGITSEDGILVGKEDTSETQKDGFTGNVKAAKDVSIAAAKDVTLDGAVASGSTNTVTLKSTTGALTQIDTEDTNKTITTQKLVTVSNKGQDLQDKGNSFRQFNFSGSTDNTINGNVTIYDTANPNLTLDGNDSKVDGEVTITNTVAGADLIVNTGFETLNSHPINLTADGALINNSTSTLKAAGDLTLTANTKNIDNQGTLITPENILLKAENTEHGSISNTKAVTADKSVTMLAGVDITNQNNVTAGTTLTMTAGNTVVNNGDLLAANDINVTGTKGITDNNNITSSQSLVNLTSAEGPINVTGNIKSATTTDITSGKSITLAGDITSGGNATLSSDGNIQVQGTIDSGNDVLVTVTNEPGSTITNGTIEVTGNVTGQKDVLLINHDTGFVAGAAAITNSGTLKTNIGNVNVTAAAGDVTLLNNSGYSIDAAQDAVVSTTNGKVAIDNNIKTGLDLKVSSATGTVRIGQNDVASVEAGQDIIIQTSNDNTNSEILIGNAMNQVALNAKRTASITTHKGNININGGVGAGEGDATIQSITDGNIFIQGSVSSTDAAANVLAKDGTIAITGDVQGYTNVTVQTNKVGLAQDDEAITNNGTIKTGTGNVSVTAASGKISLQSQNNQESIDSAQDATVATTNGTIAIDGNMTAKQDILISSTTGKVDIGQVDLSANTDITAGRNLTIQTANSTDNSDIVTDGKLIGGGTVSVTTVKGNINVSGNVQAGKGDAILKSTTAGNVTGDSSISSTDAGVQLIADGGAVNQKGEITAHTSVLVRSKDSLTLDDTITSGTTTDLISQGQLDFNGKITSGGNTTLDSQTGATMSGSINSQAGVGITNYPSGIIDITGDVTGKNNVTVYNGNATLQPGTTAISNTGSLTSTEGSVSVTSASGDISMPHTANKGDVKAKLDITISTGTGNVALDGIVNAERDILINSDTGKIDVGTNAVATDVTAGRNVTIQTKNDTADSNINVYGNVKGGGAASVTTHKGNIDITGNVDAGTGDATLQSTISGNVTNHGYAKSAAAAVKLIADGGAVNQTGDITAGTSVLVRSLDALTLNDYIISGTTTGLISQNNVDLNGTIKSGSNATIDSQTGTTVDGSINSEDGVKITNHVSGTIDITGNVTAKNDVSLSNENATLIQGQTGISNTGKLTSAHGSVSAVTNSGDVTLLQPDINKDSVDAAKDLTISTSNGTVAVDGKVKVGQDIKINSNTGKVAIGQADSNTTMDMTAGRDLIISTSNDTTNSDIIADGNLIGGRTVSATTHQGNIDVTGNVDAGTGDAILQSTISGNVTNHGYAKSAAAAVKLIADGGAVNQTGDITADTYVLVRSRDALVLDSTVTSGTTTDIISQNNIDLTGSIKSGGNTTLESKTGDKVTGSIVSEGAVKLINHTSGAIDVAGDVTGKDDVTLSNENTSLNNGTVGITNTGSITSKEGSASVTSASGDVSVLDISGKGTIKAAQDAIVSTTNGKVTIDGSVNADRDVLVNSNTGSVEIGLNGIISQDNDINAGRNVTIQTQNDTADSNIWIYGNVKGDGAASLTTHKGDVIVIGTVQSGTGDATLKSMVSGNVLDLGDISSDGAGVNLVAQTGKVGVDGNITAATYVASISGDSTAISGNITSGTTASLTSGKDIELKGNIISGDTTTLTSTTGTKVEGSINSGDGVNVTNSTSGTIDITGNVIGNNDVRLANENTSLKQGEIGINNTGAITSDNGSASVTTKSGDITLLETTGKGTVKAAQDATVSTTNGKVTIDGAVNADRDVLINSNTGEVEVGFQNSEETDIAAGRNLTIQTSNDTTGSNIALNSNITSGGATTLSTHKGDIVEFGDIKAGNGDATLQSTVSGTVFNYGDVTSTGAGVNITANDGPVVQIGNITAATDASLKASGVVGIGGNVKSGTTTDITSGEDININGKIISGDTTTMTSTTGTKVEGSINSEGGVNVTNSTSGAIDITGNVTGNNYVSLSNKNATLPQGQTGITNTGVITSETGSASVTASSGDIKISDTSGKGTVNAAQDATVSSTNGIVSIDGAVNAGRDTTINSDTGKVVIGMSGVTSQDTDVSGGRNVKITTANDNTDSDIYIYGNVTGQQNVDMSTHKGNIFIIGNVKAVDGGVAMENTVSGHIINTGTIESNNANVYVHVNDGNFINGNDITSNTGSVIIVTNKGSIDVGGNIDAKTNVEMEAQNGINTDGHVVAGESIVQTVTGDGTIVNGNGIQAGADLTEVLQGKGDLHVNNSLKVGQDMNLIANNGSVTLDLPGTSDIGGNMYVTAINGDANINGYMGLGGDGVIRTENGNVNFNGTLTDPNDTSSITLEAKNGNINNNVNINSSGNVTERTIGVGDIYNQGYIYTKKDINLNADQGNVYVLNGSDLYSSQGTITLGANKGNIYADQIDGENVNIFLGSHDTGALTGLITVGTKLGYEGDNFLSVYINQREGYTNPLHIDATGAGGNQAMNTFYLTKVTAPNGIIMDRLWSNYAIVNAVVPMLQMEKLRIEKDGYFFTPATSATVYGPGGAYDRLDDLRGNAFYASTSANPWQKLYLKQNGNQYGDGILLYRIDYQRVDDQRYSGVDWSMHLLENEMAKKMYDKYQVRNKPGTNYGDFWRYDLIDYRDMLQ